MSVCFGIRMNHGSPASTVEYLSAAPVETELSLTGKLSLPL